MVICIDTISSIDVVLVSLMTRSSTVTQQNVAYVKVLQDNYTITHKKYVNVPQGNYTLTHTKVC